MAQISLANGAAPALLSKNYLTADADLVNADVIASANQSLVHRIYDMDPLSYWVSVTASDGQTETITFGLYSGTLQISAALDFFAFTNINLREFKLEYSNDNGVTWATVPNCDRSATPFTGANFVISNSSAVTANKLRLTMYNTQVANQTKQVGDIIVASGTYQISYPMSSYEPKPEQNRKDVVMGDGSLDFTYIYRSDASWTLYKADVGFDDLTSNDRTQIKTVLFNTAGAFLWYPEPYDNPGEIYLCVLVPKTWAEKYTAGTKAAGWTIKFVVQEIGGSV